MPVVNLIELHPRFPQDELRAFHDKHGVLTEAWSPLERGRGLIEEAGLGDDKISLLDELVILNLAAVKDKTPAQIVLRWHVQLGNIIIPKSANPDRLRQNIAILDFELTADDMGQMATLAGDRMGLDPQHMSHRA